MLIALTANVNLLNKENMNPLQYLLNFYKDQTLYGTELQKYLQTISLLLERGADKSNAMNIDTKPEVVKLLTDFKKGGRKTKRTKKTKRTRKLRRRHSYRKRR